MAQMHLVERMQKMLTCLVQVRLVRIVTEAVMIPIGLNPLYRLDTPRIQLNKEIPVPS